MVAVVDVKTGIIASESFSHVSGMRQGSNVPIHVSL